MAGLLPVTALLCATYAKISFGDGTVIDVRKVQEQGYKLEFKVGELTNNGPMLEIKPETWESTIVFENHGQIWLQTEGPPRWQIKQHVTLSGSVCGGNVMQTRLRLEDR